MSKKISDLSKVKVGDKLWHYLKGYGTVRNIDPNSSDYSILLELKDCFCAVNVNGYEYDDVLNPSVFHKPIEFEVPLPPKRKKSIIVELYGNGYKSWGLNRDATGKYSMMFYESREEAEKVRGGSSLGTVKFTSEPFEVEED